MLCKQILLITFLKKLNLIFYHIQIVSSKYCYLTLVIQFNTIHMLASIMYECYVSFVYTQLNDQTTLFKQFNLA